VIGRAAEGIESLGTGRVSETSFQGTHLRARVTMQASGGDLLLRAPATLDLAVRSTIQLSVRPVDVVLLKG